MQPFPTRELLEKFTHQGFESKVVCVWLLGCQRDRRGVEGWGGTVGWRTRDPPPPEVEGSATSEEGFRAEAWLASDQILKQLSLKTSKSNPLPISLPLHCQIC